MIALSGDVRRALKGDYALNEGERVVISTAGGGGYGSAWDRDIDAVLRDVHHGYVSAQAAREQYGVVLDKSGSLDVDATQGLRKDTLPRRSTPESDSAITFSL
jgi:N-methylhydantoinase B